MRRQDAGHIVNVASVVGKRASPFCAAYVASAARLGRFDQAWSEMLRAYDRNSNWPLPGDCRVALVDYRCPEGQRTEYADYPEALRAFLVQQGYIER